MLRKNFRYGSVDLILNEAVGGHAVSTEDDCSGVQKINPRSND